MINIEFVYAQLDHNILLRQSYMYAINDVTLNFFCLMMLPHDRNIVILDQFTYHDPKSTIHPSHVFPTLERNLSIPSFVEVGPRSFQDQSIRNNFLGTLPSFPPKGTS